MRSHGRQGQTGNKCWRDTGVPDPSSGLDELGVYEDNSVGID